MVNRLIRYGYKLLDGKLVPDENEALIVMEIFQKYVNGNSLKSIAEELNIRGIIYFGEKCGWNKRRIASMIEEQKYIGEKDYPKLISNELFEAANIVKNRKSFKPKVCSNEVDACKTIVYCGQCGKAMHRKSLWDTREKWICNGGCKCSKYMDDNEIISAVKNAVEKIKKDTSFLETYDKVDNYEKTPEIMKYTNEIVRLTNSAEPNFKVGKKMILECVNLKFQACKEDKRLIYTNKIKQFIREMGNDIDVSNISEIVSKVIVNQDGSIAIMFINGLCINNREVNDAGTSEKSCNEDRCQSDSCQTE